MEGALLPIIIFVLVYVALTFELVNKAVAAGIGRSGQPVPPQPNPGLSFRQRPEILPQAQRGPPYSRKTRTPSEGQTGYDMTIHSHCPVDLQHVDFIVREDGGIPRDEFCPGCDVRGPCPTQSPR